VVGRLSSPSSEYSFQKPTRVKGHPVLVDHRRDGCTSGSTSRQYVHELWTSPIESHIRIFFIRITRCLHHPERSAETQAHILQAIEGPAGAHFPLHAFLAQGRTLGHAMHCYIRAEPPMRGSSSQFRGSLGLELLLFMLWLLWRVWREG